MQLFASDLWLMEPNYLRQFSAIAAATFKAANGVQRTQRAEPVKQKNVGLIRVHGAIETRTSTLGEWLGMTSYESIGQQFDAFMADDTVGPVILDVASPGGMAYGAMELANKIFEARGKKMVIAVANPMAASGAYWIAAAADRLVMTPSGDVGSVGVIREFVDVSAMLEKTGQKVEIIRSGKSPYKGEEYGVEPLSDQARAAMQSRADMIYDRFVADLAKFRSVSVDHVNEHFGKGRIVSAKDAMRAGMVDRVDTFDGIVNKVLTNRVRLGNTSVNDEWSVPTQRELRMNRVVELQSMLQDADSDGRCGPLARWDSSENYQEQGE